MEKRTYPVVSGLWRGSGAGVRGRRPRLGAEELIELGQTQAQSPAGPTSTPLPTTPVQLSAAEGKLVIGVVENLVSFANDYPIEYQSYCPPDQWAQTMQEVGTWSQEIDSELKGGAQYVWVPGDMIFRLVDLEKCVSAARDARLTSSQWAFTLSAVGAIADFVFGVTWVGVPMYVIGLGILYGRPLYAKYQATPAEPFAPALAGKKACLSGSCELIAMKLKKEAEADPMKRQVLERVIVPQTTQTQAHHWGTVTPAPGGREGAVFLAKGRFRVRVEGWVGDVVQPTPEWHRTTAEDCVGDIQISVWSVRSPRLTQYGPVNADSGHEGNYWVEYVGPNTGGIVRKAGPFGCTGDPVDHAMEDAGFSEAGEDGGYVIFDEDGRPVQEETQVAA